MEIIEFFNQNTEVAVAFSGGVDSAVLLYLAARYAGRVKAYYVKTAFQPAFELEDAKACAAMLGVPLDVLTLDIFSDAAITANPANRCYLCKRKIFGAILQAAKADGFATVLDGTNADDSPSERPGMQALKELCVLSPLRLCGLHKADIRQIAREQEIPVADKPSYACLATRVPAGTAITKEILVKTEDTENRLREAGLKNFRVRYQNGAARLELGSEEFLLFMRHRDTLSNILLEQYTGAVLDLKERKSDE